MKSKGYGKHDVVFPKVKNPAGSYEITLPEKTSGAGTYPFKVSDKSLNKEELTAIRKEYGRHIMEALVETLDIEENDSKASISRLYTADEIFETVLEYQGIIGYDALIKEFILEIYGIDIAKVRVDD